MGKKNTKWAKKEGMRGKKRLKTNAIEGKDTRYERGGTQKIKKQ